MRIYLTGSHSSGKTSLCRYISETYKLPMLSEVARLVLAEMEIPLERLRVDLALVNQYQKEIFARQLKIEQGNNFVSDRAFDFVAYAAEHSLITTEITQSKEFKDYIEWIKTGTVLFLRPQKSLLTEDGTRETPTWESVLRIDGMLKLLLELHQVKYLPIYAVSMQERARTIQFILER